MEGDGSYYAAEVTRLSISGGGSASAVVTYPETQARGRVTASQLQSGRTRARAHMRLSAARARELDRATRGGEDAHAALGRAGWERLVAHPGIALPPF